MTYDDVITMLEEAGLPLAYDHFAEGESPDPPFLVFLYPGSDNMFADDTVFKKIDELNIELYTDVKDPETETQIEDILIAHDLPYEKSEVWIESEKLYEVLYQTQIKKKKKLCLTRVTRSSSALKTATTPLLRLPQTVLLPLERL